MEKILQNKKILLGIVLILAVGIIIYFGWTEGLNDGYQNRNN